MKEYHKIETLLDRDEKFKVIENKWRLPEFESLKDNKWFWTEKIDGTNIRVMWDGQNLTFGGKTDNAQMPKTLLNKLQQIFQPMMFAEFTDGLCLYGEGFGAGIQRGGCYIPNGVDFILFDAKIGEWWLEWGNVKDIAEKLHINTVPVIGAGTLQEAIDFTRKGFNSTFGQFSAEGLVVRTPVTMFTRRGNRIIGKIKGKDF